jgi:hypothetical protein
MQTFRKLPTIAPNTATNPAMTAGGSLVTTAAAR